MIRNKYSSDLKWDMNRSKQKRLYNVPKSIYELASILELLSSEEDIVLENGKLIGGMAFVTHSDLYQVQFIKGLSSEELYYGYQSFEKHYLKFRKE